MIDSGRMQEPFALVKVALLNAPDAAKA